MTVSKGRRQAPPRSGPEAQHRFKLAHSRNPFYVLGESSRVNESPMAEATVKDQRTTRTEVRPNNHGSRKQPAQSSKNPRPTQHNKDTHITTESQKPKELLKLRARTLLLFSQTLLLKPSSPLQAPQHLDHQKPPKPQNNNHPYNRIKAILKFPTPLKNPRSV